MRRLASALGATTRVAPRSSTSEIAPQRRHAPWCRDLGRRVAADAGLASCQRRLAAVAPILGGQVAAGQISAWSVQRHLVGEAEAAGQRLHRRVMAAQVMHLDPPGEAPQRRRQRCRLGGQREAALGLEGVAGLQEGVAAEGQRPQHQQARRHHAAPAASRAGAARCRRLRHG
jgi:hypothetical protein